MSDARPDPADDIPPVIDAEELSERLRDGQPPLVLDVRTDEELALARIDAETVHVPLHLLPLRLGELPAEREYAVVCHTGVRSHQATQFLRQRGYAGARNLRGGIDHWSRVIDPRVPRY